MITHNELLDAVEKQLKSNTEIDVYFAVEQVLRKPIKASVSNINGKMYIYHAGKDYSEPIGTQQTNLTTFGVWICLRNTYVAEHGEDIIDVVRQELTNELYIHGFQPYCISETPEGEDENGTWCFDVLFVVPGLNYVGE